MNYTDMNYTKARNICKEKGTPCEYATELGYCKVTACIKHTETTNGTRTITIKQTLPIIGKACEICEGFIPNTDPHHICERCRTVLKRRVDADDPPEGWVFEGLAYRRREGAEKEKK